MKFYSIFLCVLACTLGAIHGKHRLYYERDAESIKQLTREIQEQYDKRNQWRSIKDLTRNTVVQIFSQIAEYDWLQPFRTPAQFAARGSGFFINEHGYIITNAHVVDQAVAVWIQMPESLGKWPIRAHIIGMCPDRDIALLKVDETDLARIKNHLEQMPYLYLGNSDTICRADEVLGLGYPLGQESLKCTNGIISGREHVYQYNQYFIQTDTPINPGNSGGPLINVHGEVIGINTAMVADAQNIGYAIPINDLKIIIHDLLTTPILHKPFSGLITVKENEYFTKFLNNPEPGGCFVLEVVKESLLDKIGIKHGDMIYKINGLPVDIYGEVCVNWNNEVRLSIADYISSLGLGESVLLEVYREGVKHQFSFTTDYIDPFPIRRYYPWHEVVEYEVFAGMVIMPLTLNHVKILGEQAPGLTDYTPVNAQKKPVLVVTHIFPNSEVARGRSVAVGFTINRVNGCEVHTIEEFRNAIENRLYDSAERQDRELVHMEFTDQISCLSNRVPVVLPMPLVTNEIIELSSLYRYPVADWIQKLHNKIHPDAQALVSLSYGK